MRDLKRTLPPLCLAGSLLMPQGALGQVAPTSVTITNNSVAPVYANLVLG